MNSAQPVVHLQVSTILWLITAILKDKTAPTINFLHKIFSRGPAWFLIGWYCRYGKAVGILAVI